jgi:hypothetical protein
MLDDAAKFNRQRWEALARAGIWESISTAVDPEPGTFAHCETIAPPWLTVWARRASA